MFSFMKKILPKYFSSEWSFAQFRLPESDCIAAFANENGIIGKFWIRLTLTAISPNGTYYYGEFDIKNGGEVKKKEQKALIEQWSNEGNWDHRVDYL